MSWQHDKRQSDVFIPEIAAILGCLFICEPPPVEDMENNTDLIVLGLGGLRFACRVRDASYEQRYGDEFTIRSGRPNGVKTELRKVLEGWGDYIFYGFGCKESGRLTKWAVGDLKVLRIYFSEYLTTNGGNVPGQENANHDGSSTFRAFKWAELPTGFVFANSDYNELPEWMSSRQPIDCPTIRPGRLF